MSRRPFHFRERSQLVRGGILLLLTSLVLILTALLLKLDRLETARPTDALPLATTLATDTTERSPTEISHTLPITPSTAVTAISLPDDTQSPAKERLVNHPPAVLSSPPTIDPQAVIEQSRNQIQIPAEGDPYVVGAGHTAQFGNSRFRFTSQTGPDLTSNATLTLTLAAVSWGETVLFRGPNVVPVEVEANVARYQKGPNLVEEYIARDAGIEQRWWIEALPGNRPNKAPLTLVVQLETALQLAPATAGEGFVLRAIDPVSGQMQEKISYGRALALDAQGRSRYAEMTAVAIAPGQYQLSLSLPADWLAEVTFPLLIDPLVSSLVRVDNTGTEADQERPAVAYNSTDDEFLVIWQDDRNEATDPTTDFDIFGQRVSAAGELLGNNITIQTTDYDQTQPDVAYNVDNGTYLVIWRHITTTIYAHVISATGEIATSQPITVSATTSAVRSDPAVAYGDGWLVSWQEWVSGSAAYHILGRTVNGDHSLETAFTIYGTSADSTVPAVAANSAGDFLVVWEQTVGSDTDIYAHYVSTTTVQGSAVAITGTTAAQVAPALTYDGDDDQFLVVWQDLQGTDSIRGQRLTGVYQASPQLDNVFTIASAGGDKAAPAVTYFAPGTVGQFLVAWAQDTSGVWNLRAQRVLTDGTTTGSIINLVIDSNGDGQQVALAFGPVVTNTLAVWTDERGGATDVWARLVEPDGTFESLFLVHPTPDDQERPEVAYNPDDDEYFVVWTDYRAGEADPNIFGQRISATTGLPIGDNITITVKSYRQLNPHLAYGGGVYLVAWQDYPGLADGPYHVHGAMISGTGQIISDNMTILSGGSNHKGQPTDVLFNSTADEFLVLVTREWTAKKQVWGQRVTLAGPTGAAIEIKASGSLDNDDAAGAYNAEQDQYLIVWEERSRDILGRLMTGGGTVTTTNLSLATGASTEIFPDVIYLPDLNRYVASWDNGDIYGRLVRPNSTLDGVAYPIASGAADQTDGRLAADGQGGALVIWDQGDNVYGRRLDSAGQPLDDLFSIMTDPGQQDFPTLAGDGVDHFFLTWQDGRNGNWDIYGQLFQDFQANFIATPLLGQAPLGVVFTDTSTPVGSVDEWRWHFGDGQSSSIQQPIHAYTLTGSYTVTLMITNTDTGETDMLVRPAYISVTTAPDWQLVTTTLTPSAKSEYMMAYDTVRQVLLLYGGNEGGWPYENTTWEFDGSDWSLVTTLTQTPTAVYGGAMAYDSVRERMVLFGGHNSADQPLNQTWEYNGTDWIQSTPLASPPARVNAALVYDAANEQILLFGGNDGGTYYNDLWVYEGTTWTELSPTQVPPPRTLAGMAYNSDKETVLLFGGRTVSGTSLANLWQFDPTTENWTEIATSGPVARMAHGFGYQAEANSFILVAGTSDASDTLLNDSWHYLVGIGWLAVTPVTTLPEGAYVTVVYDSDQTVMYLFIQGQLWKYE